MTKTIPRISLISTASYFSDFFKIKIKNLFLQNLTFFKLVYLEVQLDWSGDRIVKSLNIDFSDHNWKCNKRVKK